MDQIILFTNSAIFNRACKVVYYFVTALAIGLYLSGFRGAL
jgi:hypothetical protein